MPRTDWTHLLESITDDPTPERRTIGARLGVSAAQTGTIRTKTSRRRFTDQTGRDLEVSALLPELPQPGEAIHWLLDGSFTMGAVIPHIQSLIAEPVKLTLATLGTNLDTAQTLADMLKDGRLTGLRMALSSYFQSADKETCAAVVDLLTRAGATVAVERNHAKVQLYAPATSTTRYVIETSSNLRSCNCVEVATVTNDPELYRWHDQWLTRFFDTNAL